MESIYEIILVLVRTHLIATSSDSSDETITAFLEKTGTVQADFIHIMRDKDNQIAEQYKAQVLPTSLFLGKGLKVVKRIPGELDWEDPELIKFIKEMPN